ncbi:unnamed protein product [Ectocarpus sp. 12 AP-2014]
MLYPEIHLHSTKRANRQPRSQSRKRRLRCVSTSTLHLQTALSILCTIARSHFVPSLRHDMATIISEAFGFRCRRYLLVVDKSAISEKTIGLRILVMLGAYVH